MPSLLDVPNRGGVGMVKVWCGWALCGGSRILSGRRLFEGRALRLRVIPALKLSLSSGIERGLGVGAVTFGTIGEYGRGVGAGENDETCSRMTNSCVALVTFPIWLRNSAESGCASMCDLMALDSWITIWEQVVSAPVQTG